MNKANLIRHIGNMEQLASVRSYTVDQGPMKGIKMHHLDGGPLTLTVMESRGMDILDMRYKGTPLNFLSKCGAMAREHVDPVGMNFLRGISGGMLYTCGLNNVGNEVETEQGIDYFHGRLRLLPADKVSVEQDWDERGYRLAVSGRMRQAGLFRENMVLKRTVETYMGERTVMIRNTVINEGIREEPLMIMFHVNVGFPVLSGNAELFIPTKRVYPMSERAKELPEAWSALTEPSDEETETVYVHEMLSDSAGMTHACVYNPVIKLGLGVSFRTDTLPKLLEWRSMGSTDYVLGLQPTNCFAAGRTFEEQNGALVRIAAGESKDFDVQLTVLDGDRDRDMFAEKINCCKR